MRLSDELRSEVDGWKTMCRLSAMDQATDTQMINDIFKMPWTKKSGPWYKKPLGFWSSSFEVRWTSCAAIRQDQNWPLVPSANVLDISYKEKHLTMKWLERLKRLKEDDGCAGWTRFCSWWFRGSYECRRRQGLIIILKYQDISARIPAAQEAQTIPQMELWMRWWAVRNAFQWPSQNADLNLWSKLKRAAWIPKAKNITVPDVCTVKWSKMPFKASLTLLDIKARKSMVLFSSKASVTKY